MSKRGGDGGGCVGGERPFDAHCVACAGGQHGRRFTGPASTAGASQDPFMAAGGKAVPVRLGRRLARTKCPPNLSGTAPWRSLRGRGGGGTCGDEQAVAIRDGAIRSLGSRCIAQPDDAQAAGRQARGPLLPGGGCAEGVAAAAGEGVEQGWSSQHAPSSKRTSSTSCTCPIQYSTGLVGASGETAGAWGEGEEGALCVHACQQG